MDLKTFRKWTRSFRGPLGSRALTVLLFTHADQILQDPDALLHRLQLCGRARPTALHCLQLLHHEWSQGVDVRGGKGAVGVLKHRQQQLVTPRLNLWNKKSDLHLCLLMHKDRGALPAPHLFAHFAYPGVTRVEGISEAVDAAFLEDHHSNQLITGWQQEERDGGQHADLIHIRPGFI